MAKSPPLADLDIEAEAITHTDGLASRVARARGQPELNPPPAPQARGRAASRKAADQAAVEPTQGSVGHNAWRRDKAMLMVPMPEDIHVELAIVAKQRRTTMSAITREALNAWLEAHGYNFRVPQ
jgi:hypothetical protein